MCSTELSADQYEPWPNDMFAVYTTTQGGDSKDMSWVEGVTLLSSEEQNIIAFWPQNAVPSGVSLRPSSC